MKKTFPFLLFFALTIIFIGFSVYAANITTGQLPDLSPAQPTDKVIITRNLGSTTTTGNVAANTLGVPASPSGSLQYNNNGSNGALTADTLASYAAHNTVMNGLAYDPRDPAYGAICGGINHFATDGVTKTFTYTIPFTGSGSTDNTNFFVYYTPNNGFGTATMLTAADYTVTGVNSGGGTITLNSAPASGNLLFVYHDDGPGLVAASTAAAATSGYISIPDGCTIYTDATLGTQLAEGAQLVGGNFTPNYAFNGSGVKPTMTVIDPAGHAPAFGFNVSGKNQQFFEGFTITSNVPGVSTSVGFQTVPVLIGANGASGAGGGQLPGITLQYMTVNYGKVGFGAPETGNSAYIFATLRFNTFSANDAGVYGPLSDPTIIGNDFVSNGNFGSIGTAGGLVLGPQQGAPGGAGAGKVTANRFEFNLEGVVMKSGFITTFDGNEFDTNSACGLDLRSWGNINITGGWFRASGHGGSGTGNTTAGQDAHVCINGSGSGLHISNTYFVNGYGRGYTAPIGSANANTPLYFLDVNTAAANVSDIQISNADIQNSFTAGAYVTDFATYRQGIPLGVKIDAYGQAEQGTLVNGRTPAQAHGLPSNNWNSYLTVGDLNVFGAQLMDNTRPFPVLISNSIGIAPQYEATNSFSDFQSDVVSLKVFGSTTTAGFNPTTHNNPVVTFFPSVSDPTYGGGASTSHRQIVDSIRRAALAWLADPVKYKTYGQNSACVQTGTWSNSANFGGALGVTSNTNTDSLSCTVSTYGAPIYVWYGLRGGDGGTFTYQVDGGTASSNVATNGVTNDFTFPMTANGSYPGGIPISVGFLRLPVQSIGSHTVNFALSSTTSTNNTATIYALGTAPPLGFDGGNPTVFVAGQIKEVADGNSATTLLYDTDIRTDAAMLFSDGLSVNFVDVRNSVCCDSTTDVKNTLDLSPMGQKHVADVFTSTMQPQPNPTMAIDPRKYGAVCNARKFTGTFVDAGHTHLVTVTSGSNQISISNYTVNPGAASCSGGGGDGGQVITLFNNSGSGLPPGPTTYISTVTTSTNKLTLAPGWSSIYTNSGLYAIIGGCPSNPNDWSTAHDDSAGIIAATQAASSATSSITASLTISNAGMGKVVLPNNCFGHDILPANAVKIEGNNGGGSYGTQNNPGVDVTRFYVASNMSAFEPQNGFKLAGRTNVELSNFTMTSVAFPWLGYGTGADTGTCLDTTGEVGNLGADEPYIHHMEFFNCPIGLGQPFGLGMPVTFTGSIDAGSNQLTVLAITSSGFSPEYKTPGLGASVADTLALNRTITGSTSIAGARLLNGPSSGQAGTYTLSLNATATLSSAALSSAAVSNVTAGTYELNRFNQNGIGTNGDFSDSTWLEDVWTGNFFEDFHMGPNNSGSGNHGNRFIGGRFEVSARGFICTGCGAQFVGTQFQGHNGANITFNPPGNSNSIIDVTGGWFEGGGGGNASGLRAHVIMGGNNSTLSVTGLNGDSFCVPGNPCNGNASQYFLATTTGFSNSPNPNIVTIEAGGEAKKTATIALTNFAQGTPTTFVQNVPFLPIINNSQPITVGGALAYSSTNAIGGAAFWTNLSTTTTGPGGVISITGLAPSPNIPNCTGGDLTTGAGFPQILSSTTSSAAALNITSTVTAGDQIRVSCPGGN